MAEVLVGMAARAVRLLGMTGCAVVICGCHMGVVGRLSVLSGMAGVTLVIGRGNRCSARHARSMAAGTTDIPGVGMRVVACCQRPLDVMAARTGRCGAMTCCTVVIGRRDMGVVGCLAVLGGMTGVTGIVRLDDRLAARCTRGMAGVAGNISGIGMGVV